jgi:phosphatidylethanolamine/phosphatidyl-N-methylethanolamine N-methyltransferase
MGVDRARARYDRISRFYDVMEFLPEALAFSSWRRLAFSRVQGERILEVGVGTGKNFSFYPAGASITAIDLSPRMLRRARRKAERDGVDVDLREMNIERLQFEDSSFDSVIATFVFCSVTHPVEGLAETRRVCKKDGKIVLLEHVRPAGKTAGKIFDLLNRITVRLAGANINRDTVANTRRAGLTVLSETKLFRDIVKLISAAPQVAKRRRKE